jgi:hypothetical protein
MDNQIFEVVSTLMNMARKDLHYVTLESMPGLQSEEKSWKL